MELALSSASITQAEQKAVLDVLRGRRLSLGPWAERFERAVANYVGARHAVAVNSGTSGLHLVMRALGIGAGDEVITTPFSFVASSNCVLFEDAAPVFVDIDPDTLCIDPDAVERRINHRTRAILAVDVFGHPADWPVLRRVARRHGLALVEDSCEALGSTLAGRRCGTFADAAVFAFYPNKQITTGEGGMVVTDRRRIADLCRSMANQGRRIRNGAWLEHVRLGYNYRLSEVNAALGVVQMRRIDSILSRRARVAGWYNRLLADVDEVRVPTVAPGVEMSWFVYVIRLADRCCPGGRPRNGRTERDRVLAGLRRRGVQCSNYFQPIHLQPYYREAFGYRRGDFPVCEAVGDRTIALPFHTRMRRRDAARVVDALKDTIQNDSRNGGRNE